LGRAFRLFDELVRVRSEQRRQHASLLRAPLFGARSRRPSLRQFSRHDLIRVTPDPGFTWLDGPHQRMARGSEMLAGMLVRR
jgi:hypothetical protein